MESIIKTYKVRVVREPGENPLTGEFSAFDEQSFDVEATNVQTAYSLSQLVCTLHFRGQLRRTFINGEEYFDKHY
ncbi:hypothetical protein GCM10027592_03570 [Spirosoma flavus]